jgi:hypothetical protein
MGCRPRCSPTLDLAAAHKGSAAIRKTGTDQEPYRARRIRVVDHPVVKMYLEPVEQATRNDIAAAAAVHHELGDDYDAAVAEGLVERIGAEIDKRVDARLGARSRGTRALEEVSPFGRHEAMWVGLGVGAAVTGLVAMVANGGRSQTLVPAVITIWLILAVTGLGTMLVRKYRSRGPE